MDERDVHPFYYCRRDLTFSQQLEDAISHEVIGQPRAVLALTRAVVRGMGGVSGGIAGTRGVLLFLGPPGTGKSHICRVLAHILFGPQTSPFTIDCQQLPEQFETLQISRALRLQGRALPGGNPYPPSIVVFDRLESAPEGFKKTLLSILDHGCVPAADGSLLDFRQSLCILLSEMCSKEILRATEGRIGFEVSPDPDSEEAEEEIFKQCFEAAETFWGPQVMSRVDRTVIFRRLHADHICRILDLKIGQLRRRFLAQGMDLILSDPARDLLITKSVTDLRYGAHRLQQSLAKYLEYPVSDLLISGQLGMGTSLYVSRRARSLHFQRVGSQLPQAAGIPDSPGWRVNRPSHPGNGPHLLLTNW